MTIAADTIQTRFTYRKFMKSRHNSIINKQKATANIKKLVGNIKITFKHWLLVESRSYYFTKETNSFGNDKQRR